MPVGKAYFFLNEAIVVNEVYYGCRNKQIEQWCRTENPETDPSYVEMLYDRSGIIGHWVKCKLLKRCSENLSSMQRKRVGSLPYTLCKNEFLVI